MHGYQCSVCGCLFDPGEIGAGGICDDCRAKAEYREARRREAERLARTEARQMTLFEKEVAK